MLGLAADMHSDDYHLAYPNAKLIGVEPLVEKRKEQFTFDGGMCLVLVLLGPFMYVINGQCMERTLKVPSMVLNPRCTHFLTNHSHLTHLP